MKASREFLTTSGEPTQPSAIQDIKMSHRDILLDEVSKNERENLELKLLIERINFDQWRSIYAEDAVKSGIDPKQMNFVCQSDVVNVDTRFRGGVAFYDSGANMIGLDYAGAKRQAKALGIEPDLYVFYLLCHEQAHAVSKIRNYMEVDGSRVEQDRVDSGYKQALPMRFDDTTVLYDIYFEGFDEGVTERYARQRVLFRYLEQHPEFGSEKQILKLRKVLHEKGNDSFYENELELVNAFIKKMAFLTGFDEEFVWEAIIQGKFAGEPLNDPETSELFRDLLGPDFVSRLASLRGNSSRTRTMTKNLRRGMPLRERGSLASRALAWLKERLPTGIR